MSSIDIVANPYKKDFPLLTSMSDLAFLDSAATAQRPACVIEAQDRFYQTMNANPLRGLYELSIEATEAIDATRKRVARFIGAGEENACDVIFNRNASEALNIVAQSFAPCVLEKGDEVCITIMEHHSNLIPWQQVCKKVGAKLVYMYCDKSGFISDEEMQAKIGPKTKIVAAAHVSNVLGVTNPIARMAQLAHENGAYLVVDGAQSVPHIPVDVTELGCAFFAFSGHKVFGPFGVGVLWGRHELLEMMPPFLTGGEMIDAVSEQDAVWSPTPEKFEAGTQDAAGIFATGAALTYLTESVGYAAVAEREAALVAYAWERLAELDYVDLIGSADPARHHGVISFNVRGVHPHDAASILDASGVCIRAGHHCAQPLLAWLGVENLACCRASLAFYNDAADVDRLVDGLSQVWGIFHGSD